MPELVVEVFRDKTALKRDAGIFIAGLGLSTGFLAYEANSLPAFLVGGVIVWGGGTTMYLSRRDRLTAEQYENYLLEEEMLSLNEEFNDLLFKEVNEEHNPVEGEEPEA